MSYIGAKPINENNGGTNQSTYTTGDMLYASATNTLSKLPIATNIGSQLVYDGTNVYWFDPLKDVWFFDDFICGGTAGSYVWVTTVANSATSAAQNNANLDGSHPGIIALNTNANAAGAATIKTEVNGDQGAMTCGGGAIDCYWIVRLSALSSATDSYIVRIGLGSSNNAAHVAGIYFEYTDTVNSGNWQGLTANASTRSTLNGATAVSTAWTTLRVNINAAASLATFYVNGVSIGTLNSNIPAAASNNSRFSPSAMIVKTGGSTGTTNIILTLDKCFMFQKMTSAR